MRFIRRDSILSLSLHAFLLICLLGMLFFPLSIYAQNDRLSQTQLNALIASIEDTYGVGFAFPPEWQAQTADELLLFYGYLISIETALEVTASRLWLLNGAPDNLSPTAHFRRHFDQANILIDRVRHLGSYGGNTQPLFENGRIIAYLIQIAPAGFGQSYTLAHEIGHVLDGLLYDLPQKQHREALGGVWTLNYWIPGEGFIGNENLFPRATAGPNEDFADTFGQMMIGNLNPDDSTAPRWEFMTTYVPRWLHLLQALAATRRLFS